MDHFLDLVTGKADAREERSGLLLPHDLADDVERAVGQPA